MEDSVENQLNNIGFNLKGVKDVTLNNNKRILVIFPEGKNEPIVIDFDRNANILEELKKRQTDYIKYQGDNSLYNAEELLKDIAKEQNSYVEYKTIEGYEPSPKVMNDKNKMKIISSLLKKAAEKNNTLSGDDRFMYIDEDNDFIMTNTGLIIEGKIEGLDNEIIVESPEYAGEHKNEEINEENIEQDNIVKTDEELDEGSNIEKETEEEYSREEKYTNVYDEVFRKGGVPDDKEAEIIDNLRKIDDNPDLIEDMDKEEQEWYYVAYDKMKEYEKGLDHTKRYIYEPGNNSETGVSNYLYIAILVLFIVFVILMYLVFRR